VICPRTLSGRAPLGHAQVLRLSTGGEFVSALSAVRQAFPSGMRVILPEIHLCRTCSCQEILRMETPGQEGAEARLRAAMKAGVGRPSPAINACRGCCCALP
jgi:hypothetical protein